MLTWPRWPIYLPPACRFDQAQVARLTSPLGTDLTLELGNPNVVLDGICHERGELDTFPAGLPLSVPRAGRGHGRAWWMVQSPALAWFSAPVTLHFERGGPSKLEGGPEADCLSQLLAHSSTTRRSTALPPGTA